MNRLTLRSNLLLLLTALIWGVAFVAQSVGMDYVGPFTFNAVRCLVGAAVLAPCIVLLDRMAGKKPSLWGSEDRAARRATLAGGTVCGVLLAVASSLQQMGIAFTTVGKAGFITALYIVIVPVLGLLGGHRPHWVIWVSVGLATAGLYLLCITGSFSLSKGDLLVLLCAVAFSVHILTVDHFSGRVDSVRMSCLQFLVCGILCAIPMLLWERPTPAAIGAAWLPIGYAGVLSCAVGYTLQVVAQKNTSPVVASLLMSLESVFAVLAGWVLLRQGLSLREFSGCALMFAAILLAQLPQKQGAAPQDKTV